jgi:predicted dehydrogenase
MQYKEDMKMSTSPIRPGTTSGAENNNDCLSSRRQFLKSSLLAGLSVPIAGMMSRCASTRNVLGANDRVRLGVAGLRIKGAQHIEVFQALENVQIAAICDVDSEILDRERSKLQQKGVEVSVYTDYRKMLEKKDLDAIIIAAPNHWHALMGVWACQAGKDVYVEKPVSHSVWEGRQLVRAARRYRRIVQAGIQKRSDTGLIEAFDYIRQGNLGKIKLARGLCYKRRRSIGRVNGPQPIPGHIDYNLWTGPAPMQPLMRRSLHYDWHWVWNTGNGDLGNQGIHEVDLCRWVLDEKGYPDSVQSYGGRYGYTDDGETPNTQVIVYEYKSAPLLFEVRGLPASSELDVMDNRHGIRIGVVIHCENGFFAGGDGGGWMYTNEGVKIKQFVGSGGVVEHAMNFIQTIRSRKIKSLAGDIEEGHISSALCHLGNISYRLGTDIERKTVVGQIAGRDWEEDVFSKFCTHLESNGVSLVNQNIRMGPKLEMEPDTESLISHADFDLAFFANGLLKDRYRPPFIIDARV